MYVPSSAREPSSTNVPSPSCIYSSLDSTPLITSLEDDSEDENHPQLA